MKYRMHKRVETKPDGRKIYYYTFEPAGAQEHKVPDEPASESNTESNPAGKSWGRETTFTPAGIIQIDGTDYSA
jgi:hypothetical protein